MSLRSRIATILDPFINDVTNANGIDPERLAESSQPSHVVGLSFPFSQTTVSSCQATFTLFFSKNIGDLRPDLSCPDHRCYGYEQQTNRPDKLC